MSFFFIPAKNKKKMTADAVQKCRALECAGCPLNEEPVKSPKMEPTGSKRPDLYILGEGPGKTEDDRGEQFVGKSGRLLRSGLGEEYELRFNNCVRTRPPKNRNPTWQEIEACRPSIERDIAATKPRAIVGVGGVALSWACGEDAITGWRGRRFPIEIKGHVCWFYPILHPAYILRQGIDSAEGQVFATDLQAILEDLSEGDEPELERKEDAFDNIGWVAGKTRDDFRRVVQWLEYCETLKTVGIDIETNGLRPYAEGSKILSIAIGTYDETLAFPLEHSQAGWSPEALKGIKAALKKFLLSPRVRKIAHNLIFELEWLSYFFGAEIVYAGRWEDTMAQAYVLDERKQALSLNALCVLHLGLPLKALTAGAANVKNLDAVDLPIVLQYNCLDTKYTEEIYYIQHAHLKEEGLTSLYREHQLPRVLTLALTQLEGLPVDAVAVEAQDRALENKIKEVLSQIEEDAAVRKFEERFKEKFKAGSPAHVLKLFRDLLGYDEELKKHERDGDRYSTDKTILAELDHPLAEQFLDWRTLTKLKSTYIDGCKPGGKYLWPDGRLHPELHSCFTSTGRLSSSNPNGQNFPNRTHAEIRSIVSAPKDHLMLCVDYGQIEARVIAMASKDKTLMDSLWQNWDIHSEWAKRLSEAYPRRIGGERLLDDPVVMKKFRTDVKNQMVFPAFYGASPDSIAGYLRIPQSIIDDQFEDFWDMFPGVLKWQKWLSSFYKKYGYVECLTGRRRHEPMTKNEYINSPIQGTASDIVVDAMNRLSRLAYNEGKRQYQAVLNVHDELIFFVPEKSFDEDMRCIVDAMLDCRFEFVNVPISVEPKVGPNWYELKEMGTFYSHEENRYAELSRSS